jgi:hypothetical protein
MSLLNLKWLISMDARLGVGQKMLQLVTRMSTCSGRMPAGQWQQRHVSGCCMDEHMALVSPFNQTWC